MAQQKKTWAVVTGISQYSSRGITSLRFAHRDAAAFADYLQSANGGQVPAENIRLLVNEEATTAAIYDALSWLLENASENDDVYFYFAGHGDMESETLYKLGFLLAYNTPRTNYINNAVRIEDINNIANTLSVKNKARVIIITDACHSGNLAGNGFKGNLLVGEQLRTAMANEVRITSCGPDQLAMEDEAWGGGRGIFSYYLINGLQGYADQKKDGQVKLYEVRNWLDTTMRHDPVLRASNRQQHPVLKGNEQTVLSQPTQPIDTAIRISPIAPVPVAPFADLPPGQTALNTVMTWMDRLKFEELTHIDFTTPASKTAALGAVLNMLLEANNIMAAFQASRGAQQTVASEAANINDKLQVLKEMIKTDSILAEQVRTRLLVKIHNKTQEVINQYLEGDEAELERRRYYHSYSKGYSHMNDLLYAGILLTEPDDLLHRIFKLNRLYFGGLAQRLRLPLTNNPKPLIDSAWQQQEQALAMQPNAAYVHNELGLLCMYRSQLKQALRYFQQATALSPQWALPWSNAAGVMLQRNMLDSADWYVQQAKTKQSDLQNAWITDGLISEKNKEYLIAEEKYRYSIWLNSRHYLPFERLGHVLMRATGYADADSFFFEADARKRGFNFHQKSPMAVDAPNFMMGKNVFYCLIDTNAIRPDDYMALFAWAKQAYDGNSPITERLFRKLIALYPRHPLAWHYLGHWFYLQNRMQEAELLLLQAINLYMNKAQLDEWCKANLQNRTDAAGKCYGDYCTNAFYDASDNDFLLASLYQQRADLANAGKYYQRAAMASPTFFVAPKMHADMLMQYGLFEDAEKVLLEFYHRSPEAAAAELHWLYRTAIAADTLLGKWYLKGGNFLHRHCHQNRGQHNDALTILPDKKTPSRVVPETIYGTPQPQIYKIEKTKHEQAAADVLDTPMTTAILWLQKALLLDRLAEAEVSAVEEKLGDLYQAVGVPLYAAKHYHNSLKHLHSNNAVRSKLIAAAHTTYQYNLALQNLDTLAAHRAINFNQQLLLARYLILNSQFARADSLMQFLKPNISFTQSNYLQTEALLALLRQTPATALPLYQNLLKQDTSNAAIMYSISTLYAMQKNKRKTLEWLQKAIVAGFNYKYVLDSDPWMDIVRKEPEWKKLMESFTPKTYRWPLNVEKRTTGN